MLPKTAQTVNFLFSLLFSLGDCTQRQDNNIRIINASVRTQAASTRSPGGRTGAGPEPPARGGFFESPPASAVS